MRLLFSIVFLNIAQIVLGQNLSSDLEEMAKYYDKNDKIKIQVSVSTYSQGEKQPKMSYKTTIQKSGKRFYSLMDGTEMLLTEQAVLMVNNRKRAMVYRKVTPEEAKIVAGQYKTAKLDSTLNKYDSVRYEQTGGIKKYTIYAQKNAIQKVEIYFDQVETKIVKMTYHYNKSSTPNVNKVEIVFTYNTLNDIAQKLMSEETYLTKIGKVWYGTQKYTGYEINVVDTE